MARKKKDASYMPTGDGDEKKSKYAEEEHAWGRRLGQSKGFQKRFSGEWDENRRLVFNTADGEGAKGSTPAWMGGAQNSMAYGWGLYQGLETAVYVQNPDILITSRRGDLNQVAYGLKHIVRYDIEQMDLKETGNLLLLDQFICGYGAVIEDVRTYHIKDVEGKKTGDVEDQEFDGRRIDPKDILFDRKGKRLDLSDSRFCFVAWYPTVDELRNDPEITDLPEDIENYPECDETSRSNTPEEGPVQRQAATLVQHGVSGEKDSAFKTICVWEIFDKVNRKKFYMTDHAHHIIGEGEWPVNLKFGAREYFPITLLFQHPVPGRLYPMPEASLIAPQLREINVVERMISEDTRTKWRKYLTLAGILTDEQKSQVTDTTLANALIFVDFAKVTDVLGLSQTNFNPEQVDLRRLVVPMEDVSPKKDLFSRYDMLEKEIQHIVGYGPAARGGLPSTRSAREAMMINQEKERKLDKRKSRIADFYQKFAMKHVRFLQKYMAGQRYAKIYEKTADVERWFKYNREDIQGDFEFEVLAGTSVPKNTETRKASELDLWEKVAPVIQSVGGDLRPAFYRLAEFFDWDNVDAIFGGMLQQAEQMAEALDGFEKGKVNPAQLVNGMAKLIMTVLGPARMKMLADKKKQAMKGGAGAEMMDIGELAGARGDPTPAKTAAGVL